MSHRFSGAARPRSASLKPKSNMSDMPSEYISQNNQPKPRNSSGLKIEDKLLNNQIAAKKRLESLKKSLEQEQMREIRNKPKISEKSRILAERHERKLFQQFSDVKEVPPQPQQSDNIYVQVQPEVINRKSLQSKIIVESVPYTSTEPPSPKKRTKSLLNLSYNESEDLSTVRKDMTKIADEIDKKSDELYELKKRQQQYLRSKLIL